MSKQVKYVDFGIPDAKSFWALVTLPNVVMFEQSPTIQFAINAVWALWHLHEWHWHDIHRNENTGPQNPEYVAFVDQLFDDCAALKHLRDMSDAAKHCGIGRAAMNVKALSTAAGRGGAGGWDVPSGGYGVGQLAYGSGTPQPLVVFDDDENPCWLGDTIDAAKKYWRQTLLPK
jgi:hypothetical protein